METILIVDDEKNYLVVLETLLSEEGYEVLTAESVADAIKKWRNNDLDLIVTDMKMPKASGIELLEMVKKQDTDLPVIMMTAYGTVEKAVEAMKKGAFDYVTKPFQNQELKLTIRKALEMYRLVKQNRLLYKELSDRYQFDNIVGKSKAMLRVYELVKKVANTKATVLISGESGTGKELIARSIHFNSERKGMPFISVNCSALTDTLLESELFGHEKGAFTGAFERKIGLFDVVHRGVLFLDEISEAPPFFQSKLLRVVETKTFMRVGGITPIYSDFRLLVATNRNLESEIVAGRFREDLYYRLNVYTIQIPPLRERKEDVPLLASFYLQRFSEAYRRPVREISADAMILLRDYEWPGNVRELINVIERGVITCPGPVITTAQLPFGVKQYQGASDLNLRDAEKLFIELALKRTQSNKTRAAELLGISRKTLGEKLKAYEMNDDCEM